MVGDLACYDVANTPGVAADLSHIPTNTNVTGALPDPTSGSWPTGTNHDLKSTLTGCDVVVIPAGVPRKPGMTRDDLFNTNASIVQSLVKECAEHCPKAVLAIISNPMNSTVPIAKMVLEGAGVYDKRKLCGVTTLDVCRANTFLAEYAGKDPKDVNVTVVGGHAGTTILPLFSQTGVTMSSSDRDSLTHRVQFGGDEVVQAKAGTGSATLSMAYAGYLFTENLLRAMNGEPDIVMPAYVESDVTDAEFFSTPCLFGKDGVEEVRGLGEISDYEREGIDKMMPDLVKQIGKGKDFVKSN